MGLLKTVFEVNLGLFGKKPQDGYAFLLVDKNDSLNNEILAQAEGHCCCSSFVTTLAQLHWPTCKVL
jgi:hypothetical protein